jgi:hypothetical protein
VRIRFLLASLLLLAQADAGPLFFASWVNHGGFATPAFVQAPSAPTCLSATYASAQNAGDLNVVVIGWDVSGQTISSITDTKGNTYAPALALATQGTASQRIYYAQNIAAAAAGGNTVTVAFVSGTNPGGCDLRIAEYSGLSRTGALDANANGTSASGTALSSGNATISQSAELLVGAAYVANAVSAVGAGWTQRVLSGGSNNLQDKNVTALGSYAAPATQNTSGFWIMQEATFKAAAGSAPPIGGQTLLTYLNSLRGSGKILSGQTLDHFAGASGGTYGNYLDQLTGTTPANVTVSSCSAGSGGSCTSGLTNTGLTPSIFGIESNVTGTCGSAQTSAQAIATANGQLAAGGIVQINFDEPSPTQSGCNFSGNGSEWNATTGVQVVGSTANKIFLYGNSASPHYGSGTACTSAAPCGGIWSLAQQLKAINGTVILRVLHESNLGSGSNWWGAGGGNGTAAQYVSLYQQTVTYLRSLGIATGGGPSGGAGTVLMNWNFNVGCSACSSIDPGPSYRDIISGDLYGPTTQAAVISALNGATNGFVYAQTQGVPLGFAEFGVVNFNNSVVTQFSTSQAIWDQAIQGGSSISNLVFGVDWNQNWCLQCQLNASTYLSNTITRGQLPVLH